MKRKQITADDLYNGWLQKYHNTTVAELIKNEPELIKTSAWYKKYAVSQSEHDEWYEWAITELCKANGKSLSKKNRDSVKKRFCFDYLNIAPSVTNSKTEGSDV